MTPQFPQPLIAIIGDSGTGKSTSLRNMPWDRTLFIDSEVKGIPFDPSPIKNYVACKSCKDVSTAIINVKKNPAIRYIVIDSMTKFFQYNYAECRASYKNYDIFNNYSDAVSDFLKSLRSDTQIFIVTGIPEVLKTANESGTESVSRRIFAHGKIWEGKVEPEFLIVFYTTMRKNPEGKMIHSFITNSDGICSAKTPMGMFASQLIPNDLAEALKVIDKQK